MLIKATKVSAFYATSFADYDIEAAINEELTKLQTEGKTIVSVSATDMGVTGVGPLVMITYTETSVLSESDESKFLSS